MDHQLIATNNLQFPFLTDLPGHFLWPLLILGIVLLCLMLFSVFFYFQNRKLRSQLSALNHRQYDMLRAVELIIDAVSGLKRQQGEIRKEVDIRGLYEDSSDPQLQAIHAARAGASLHYLMENFRLTQAEAELIFSIHGHKHDPDTN